MRQRHVVMEKEEDLTHKQIQILYDRFIDVNLTAMFSCYRPMWMHPDDLILRRDKETLELSGPAIDVNRGDPYVTATYAKKFDLGMDVLKNGTFWPLLIHDRPEGFFVREGNHRAAAIKILVEKGIWPKDKKVFCMVYKQNVYDPDMLVKPVQMIKFDTGVYHEEGRFIFEEYMVDRASNVIWCFNLATPYFRNLFWNSGMKVNCEKINNIKFKYYWLNKYIKFKEGK